MILASDRWGGRRVLFLALSEALEAVWHQIVFRTRSKPLCFSSQPPLSLLARKPSAQGSSRIHSFLFPSAGFFCKNHPASAPSLKLWFAPRSSESSDFFIQLWLYMKLASSVERISSLFNFYAPNAPGLGDGMSISWLSISSPILSRKLSHLEFQAILPLPFLVIWVDFSILIRSDKSCKSSALQWTVCSHWLALACWNIFCFLFSPTHILSHSTLLPFPLVLSLKTPANRDFFFKFYCSPSLAHN